MKVKSEREAQSCPTLSDPMDCSLPGSSIHGIFQARVLEWGAIAFSRPKSLQTTNVGKDVEKGKPSYTVDGDINWSSHHGEQDEDSCKN